MTDAYGARDDSENPPVTQLPIAEDATSIAALQRAVIEFRDARDWKQFHSLKNLFLGLTIEAGELAECALWKSDAELSALADDARFREKVGEEIADVFIFLLYMCHDLDLDLAQATSRKIAVNGERYPVSTSYGSARKYTD